MKRAFVSTMVLATIVSSLLSSLPARADAKSDFIGELVQAFKFRAERGPDVVPEFDRIPVIRVKMDRDGQILSSAIERPSGDDAVDANLLSHFPVGDILIPMPADIMPNSDSMTIREPIRFPGRKGPQPVVATTEPAATPSRANDLTDTKPALALSERDLLTIEGEGAAPISSICTVGRHTLYDDVSNLMVQGAPMAESYRLVNERMSIPEFENVAGARDLLIAGVRSMYRDREGMSLSIALGAWSRSCVGLLTSKNQQGAR